MLMGEVKVRYDYIPRGSWYIVAMLGRALHLRIQSSVISFVVNIAKMIRAEEHRPNNMRWVW